MKEMFFQKSIEQGERTTRTQTIEGRQDTEKTTMSPMRYWLSNDNRATITHVTFCHNVCF